MSHHSQDKPFDEGGFRYTTGVRDGVFIFEFGAGVKWIGFEKEQAQELVDRLQTFIETGK